MLKHDLITKTRGLREFYPSNGNRIGDLLDELLIDLEADAPREEVLADAKAALDEIDRPSSAHKFITKIVAELDS